MKENMKPSGIEWIGDIPESWEVGRIQYNYEVILGKMVTPEQESIDQTLENYLCAANISWNGVDVGINKQMWYSSKEKNQYLLKKGDVLIMEGGSIGTTCVYNEEFAPCYIQNSVHCCRGKEFNNTKLLYYWMSFVFNSGFLDVVCNKATIAHYTKEKVCKTPLVLIPPTEQTQIANFLDKQCSKIDSIMADLEKQIEILGQYKKSLITETVTHGLDKTAPMKDSGIEWIGEIPKHWEVKRIKDIAVMQTGTTPPGNEGINYEGEGIFWFTPSDFKEGSVELDQAEKYVSYEAIYLNSINIYPQNSVLFVGIASIGKVGFCENQSYSNQQITAIKPKKTISGKYIAYSVLASMCFIKDNALYTTVPIVNNTYLGTVKIGCPTAEEQTKIANYLDTKCGKIDSIVESKKEQLAKITDYKKSLIYEYVTGKKRVKGELNYGN